MIRGSRNTPPNHEDGTLPVRMCNELVYCERLFYLMHVQGLFSESVDTIVGSRQHDARKQRKTKGLKTQSFIDSNELEPISRSENLSSDSWGICGKMDLLEADDKQLIVVEYKKGASPKWGDFQWREHSLDFDAWPGDVAQVGLYIALLRANGIHCSTGRIYYRKDQKQTLISWSDKLANFLKEVVQRAKTVERLNTPPPPLTDSPKCPKCSMVEICLPMEHQYLTQLRSCKRPTNERDDEDPAPQKTLPRLIPGCDEYSSVHVVSPGSMIRKRGQNILVEKRDGTKSTVLGKDIGHLAIYGPSQITQQTLLYLSEIGVCITHHTGAGRLVGLTSPLTTKNITLRRAQFRCADDPLRTREIARSLVYAKITNQRTVIRRYKSNASEHTLESFEDSQRKQPNSNPTPGPADLLKQALNHMYGSRRGVSSSQTLDQIRGYEGDAAAKYFEVLPEILPAQWKKDFKCRTRRPPRDRINALLSFGYALLVKDSINAIVGVGLDPMLGFLHTMIPGRPSLALDLMEPFRAAWVDVAVLRLVATGGIKHEDFIESSLGVYMNKSGRTALISAYERRADEETTHPSFGYRMSYRRILSLDCRLLAKFIVEEVDTYIPFTTR